MVEIHENLFFFKYKKQQHPKVAIKNNVKCLHVNGISRTVFISKTEYHL